MSTVANINGWLAIAAAGIPEVAALVKDLLALRQKYPGITQDQIVQMVMDLTSRADTEFNATLGAIAADQSANKP